jgi:hypothetical protein
MTKTELKNYKNNKKFFKIILKNRPIKNLWFKLNILHQNISNDYLGFTSKIKQNLFVDFNIDCGTDYADLLFNRAKILDFYNGN